MKKCLLSIFVLFVGFTTHAQKSSNSNDPIQKQFVDGVQHSHTRGAWYSPAEAVQAQGIGNFEPGWEFLYPDSNVVILDKGGLRKPRWHSVGLTFDPTDDNYELVNDGIRYIWGNQSINIDSLAFNYRYKRYRDSVLVNNSKVKVVDTLYVQFFVYNQMRKGKFTNIYNREEVYMVPENFDSATLLYEQSSITLTYLLEAKDSTEGRLDQKKNRTIRMELPKIIGYKLPGAFGMTKQAEVGFALTYKPMIKAGNGDTLASLTGQPVSHKLNSFEIGLYTNDGRDVEQARYHSNSFFTNSSQRYRSNKSEFPDNTPGHMMLVDHYFQGFFFADIFIYTGIETIENGYGASSIYPNPAKESFSIDFVLPEAEEVKFQLVDPTGKIVRETPAFFNTGKHSLSMPADDLKAGIYYYRLQTGDYTKGGKLIIH